jgi:hypothetical protein
MRTHSIPLAALVLAAGLLGGCRDYNYQRHVSAQAGLVPADTYARYGREQAIGREFARPYNSGAAAQAEVAVNYAHTRFSGDIRDISADPQGNRLTVTFKSGWRTFVVPIADGKTGDETTIPS